LAEPDAFRWIQKAAMDKRTSMREVAQVVISDSAGTAATGDDALRDS
jgi:response regulator NasT